MTEIKTFGCRLNFYESELIAQELAKSTFPIIEETRNNSNDNYNNYNNYNNANDSHDEDKKDEENIVAKSEEKNNFVIINSCAVTNEAERQVMQFIRKINRENREKKIIVVGCAAQLNPEKYLAMEGVHKVLGNIEKLEGKNYFSSEKILVANINSVNNINKIVKPPLASASVAKIVKFAQKSRGFIQIQNGCDHDCTFCAITIARGNNRSVPIENIIAEIKAMVASGYNEIVLTGVDITDYGKDLFGKPMLSLLIKQILKDVKELPRLRLSSIDVAELDDLFLDIVKNEECFMPHIHLSLQSGDPLILKRMKRRHTPKQIYDFCHKVKEARKDVAFGADIIAGFPTEEEEMFLNTYKLVEDLKIPFLHVFPYSAKAGTKAALMPQVPMGIRKERAKKLIALADKNLAAFHLRQIGKTQKAIIEKDNIGRLENFCLIKIDQIDSLEPALEEELLKFKEKEIITTKIYGVENNYLLGKLTAPS